MLVVGGCYCSHEPEPMDAATDAIVPDASIPEDRPDLAPIVDPLDCGDSSLWSAEPAEERLEFGARRPCGSDAMPVRQVFFRTSHRSLGPLPACFRIVEAEGPTGYEGRVAMLDEPVAEAVVGLDARSGVVTLEARVRVDGQVLVAEERLFDGRVADLAGMEVRTYDTPPAILVVEGELTDYPWYSPDLVAFSVARHDVALLLEDAGERRLVRAAALDGTVQESLGIDASGPALFGGSWLAGAAVAIVGDRAWVVRGSTFGDPGSIETWALPMAPDAMAVVEGGLLVLVDGTPSAFDLDGNPVPLEVVASVDTLVADGLRLSDGTHRSVHIEDGAAVVGEPAALDPDLGELFGLLAFRPVVVGTGGIQHVRGVAGHVFGSAEDHYGGPIVDVAFDHNRSAFAVLVERDGVFVKIRPEVGYDGCD